jgi:hypothetical protein
LSGDTALVARSRRTSAALNLPLRLGAFQPPGRYGFSSAPVGAYIDIRGSHTSRLYIGVTSNLYQPHRTINPDCTRDHRISGCRASVAEKLRAAVGK